MPARIPPAPTREQAQRTALRERVTRIETLAEENRTLKSQLDALEHANKVRDLWSGIETITLQRALGAGLDQAGVGEVVAAVRSAWNNHLESGARLESFDPYTPLAAGIVEGKNSVGPTAKNASPTSPLESLPPPAQDARPALNDSAARAEAQRAAQARGRELAAKVLADRQSYKEALARHGLSDPSTGNRGNASGTGFGL